jgi:hypothetical protein
MIEGEPSRAMPEVALKERSHGTVRGWRSDRCGDV